jgi:hypothetical protein
MHTASYPPPKHGTSPVHDLKRVRPRTSSGVEVKLEDRDYRDTGSALDVPVRRRPRARGIAVRVLGYLALAVVLFLFGRVMMQNPSMRGAVLDFVTFGHPQWGHTAGQWLARHGVSL